MKLKLTGLSVVSIFTTIASFESDVMAKVDLEKLRSIAYNPHGRSGDKVRTYRRPDGQLAKEVTDELNNSVTQHGESQDVMLRPKTIDLDLEVQ